MPDLKSGTIQITGLADLEKKLRELPGRIAKNVLRGAVRAGAVVIQKEARQLAPRGAEAHYLGKGGKRVLLKPGSLKKGIKVKSLSQKQSEYAITYQVYVSKKVWYGLFVERGTSKMVAHPFLRPAFDSHKEAATVAIRDYLGPRIEKEVAKLGR